MYKAIEYYTKAYDLKCDGLFTCKEIANIYLNDFEMPNYSKALKWYQKGFDDGDKKEQENIDRVKKLLNK